LSSRVVILGAAGRDFHNFNVALRDDAAFEVIAFTAAQIPSARSPLLIQIKLRRRQAHIVD
jgi:predicted GTPase